MKGSSVLYSIGGIGLGFAMAHTDGWAALIVPSIVAFVIAIIMENS